MYDLGQWPQNKYLQTVFYKYALYLELLYTVHIKMSLLKKLFLIYNLIDRLDEVSGEEDLDLIPPRPVDDRCQCCGAVTWQGCVIS